MPATYICLFTPFFECPSKDRLEELFTVLQYNCDCALVNKIILLLEDPTYTDERFSHDKITLARPLTPRRQTFNDMLNLMHTTYEEQLPSFKGMKVLFLLCNTDIYFDESLQALVDYEPLQESCFALSRYDVDVHGKMTLKNDAESQDAWIFEMPLLDDTLSIGNYYLGRLGCDNRFAYELNAVGYRMSNPSQTLRACHLHNVPVRTWSRATDVKPPYLAVPVSALPPVMQKTVAAAAKPVKRS